MLKRLSLLIALIGCTALPATATADWHEPVGGASPLNASASRSADSANLALIGGDPYVAWNEDTTQQGQGSSSTIRVSKLASDGQSWTSVGSGSKPISLLSSTSSDQPWLADVGGTPWVAWQEGVTQQDVEIRVAKFNGTDWNEVPPTGSINHPINHDRDATDGGGNASEPTLMDDGTGHPFVSFSEFDPGTGSLLDSTHLNPGQIWVDQLNQTGDGWNEMGGGSANANPAADALFPRMTVIGGVPWIVYWQIIPPNGGPPSVDIDVAHLSNDGQSWVQVGPVTSAPFGNNGPTAGEPSIASVGGTPYVTLTKLNGSSKNEVVVYSFDGSNWNQVGGGPASDPSVDSQSPSIADIAGSPWVSWFTNSGSSQILTARLVNGAWQQVGASANDNPNHPASNGSAAGPTGHNNPAPSLASINGFPWIGFVENDETTPGGNNVAPCCTQVRVSRLEPTFQSQAAEPSDTSATLIAQEQTYGLAYPVGFQWGPGGTLTHSTALSPSNGDPAVSFTSITGLSPNTLYSYVPVATAGTPEPLVHGTVEPFVTQAKRQETPLFGFILRVPGRVHRGHPVTVRYFVSDNATAEITIHHQGHVVEHSQRTVHRGLHSFQWSGTHTQALGGYAIQLVAHGATRNVTDWVAFKVVK